MKDASVSRLVTFRGGTSGPWAVERVLAVVGDSLPTTPRVDVRSDDLVDATAGWTLRGVVSNARYVERREKTVLDQLSPLLGRTEATRAALIPIRHSGAWWALAQDERGAIFEDKRRAG